MTASVFEIQQSLNILAGTPASGVGTLDAQAAANRWAGTTGLELLAALNCRYYGVTYWPIPAVLGPVLDLNAVCNALLGTRDLAQEHWRRRVPYPH